MLCTLPIILSTPTARLLDSCILTPIFLVPIIISHAPTTPLSSLATGAHVKSPCDYFSTFHTALVDLVACSRWPTCLLGLHLFMRQSRRSHPLHLRNLLNTLLLTAPPNPVLYREHDLHYCHLRSTVHHPSETLSRMLHRQRLAAHHLPLDPAMATTVMIAEKERDASGTNCK